MLAEARARIYDADILAESLRAQSDSQSLIRILGFEILLKCAIQLCGQRPKASHNYARLWLALPCSAQKEILEIAMNRMRGHTDFSDLPNLLKWYQIVFEKGRYFYEFYKSYSLNEQQELGEYWTELGSPVEEADMRYYPNELVCLCKALDAFISARL
jgi:hypothetical protein